ncbi:MAG TPA: MaoC family dehydratase [Candidatus Acidoferrales bacterium]|nr:MaoC family dehydratase [Candidatus Acidoferrales bacterium]
MTPLVVENPQSLQEYVGQEIAVTAWFALTQERISQFAEVTEDRQWIHVDRERAHRESPFGATVAHGFLTLALASHFLEQSLQIRSGIRLVVNYGLNRVRFPSPVRAESRIRGRCRLQSLDARPGMVEAVFAMTVESEGGDKPCCVAEWVVRYYG